MLRRLMIKTDGAELSIVPEISLVLEGAGDRSVAPWAAKVHIPRIL